MWFEDRLHPKCSGVVCFDSRSVSHAFAGMRTLRSAHACVASCERASRTYRVYVHEHVRVKCVWQHMRICVKTNTCACAQPRTHHRCRAPRLLFRVRAFGDRARARLRSAAAAAGRATFELAPSSSHRAGCSVSSASAYSGPTG